MDVLGCSTEVRDTLTRYLWVRPTAHQLAEQLAVDGNLRRSRPVKLSGLAQYVWRMARFHAGHDTHMPVTCAFWLQTWLDENIVRAKVSGILDEAGKAISDDLDDLAEEVCRLLGEDPNAGARRWAGLI